MFQLETETKEGSALLIRTIGSCIDILATPERIFKSWIKQEYDFPKRVFGLYVTVIQLCAEF